MHLTIEGRYQVERLKILFLVLTYYLLGYFSLGTYNQHRSYYFNVALPFEATTPFIPVLSIPYSMVFVAIALAYFCIPLSDIERFRRSARLFTINLTIAFVFFILLPVRAQYRPHLVAPDSICAELAAFWFFVDKPTNLFPSLHVNMSVVSALVAYGYNRRLGHFITLLTVGVALGAVFLRQHYLADVIVGALLAGITHRWQERSQLRAPTLDKTSG